MPRCCVAHKDEFAPCYASVLVAGANLKEAVAAVEGATICPCVTTWCPDCFRVSLLTADMGLFPCPSAYYAHMIRLHARMQPLG
jgi:hypothetical protein